MKWRAIHVHFFTNQSEGKKNKKKVILKILGFFSSKCRKLHHHPLSLPFLGSPQITHGLLKRLQIPNVAQGSCLSACNRLQAQVAGWTWFEVQQKHLDSWIPDRCGFQGCRWFLAWKTSDRHIEFVQNTGWLIHFDGWDHDFMVQNSQSLRRYGAFGDLSPIYLKPKITIANWSLLRGFCFAVFVVAFQNLLLARCSLKAGGVDQLRNLTFFQ